MAKNKEYSSTGEKKRKSPNCPPPRQKTEAPISTHLITLENGFCG